VKCPREFNYEAFVSRVLSCQ